MSNITDKNDIDKDVDKIIVQGLMQENRQSFFLFAGAGSGKTRTLVNVLQSLKATEKDKLRQNRQHIAVITYTNAACDEIKRRLEYDSIFQISTIHSFVWELIKGFNDDIRNRLRTTLIQKLQGEKESQKKERSATSKTSIGRKLKIDRLEKRIAGLDTIKEFIYNPNGDNLGKDSLNHSEVLSISSFFLKEFKSMKEIMICRFPILLIDESQDTNKELMDTFFYLESEYSERFTLGLIGDTMQRIYLDGKEKLEESLPERWNKPSKRMNHRSPKRIITLINKIRNSVDAQEQIPRTDSSTGTVRLFVVDSKSANKSKIEHTVKNSMFQKTEDELWVGEANDVKTLILEHHMAANRMGFLELFEPLYRISKYATGLLDGTLPGLRFFTQLILPVSHALRTKDQFSIANVVKQYSPFLEKESFLNSSSQTALLDQAQSGVKSLELLWENEADPSLMDILKSVASSELFRIPEMLKQFIQSSSVAQGAIESDNRSNNDAFLAWEQALQCSFSQLEKYHEYISDSSPFGTHQGIKGLEFPRVLVILDDEEARGFLFSYEKLFEAKPLSSNDLSRAAENIDNGVDRTRRLFYVTCSRAQKSLAIVAYTQNPQSVRNFALRAGWFEENEIEML